MIAGGKLRVGRLGGSARAPVLRNQHILLGLRFRQFLIQLMQGRLQIFHLRLLIGNLLPEALPHLPVAHRTLDRDARQVVLLLVHGHLRLAHPLRGLLFVLLMFLLQHVLVGDGDGHLRFHLQQLVLHIEDDLLDHLFRIFGLVDQIVQVCAN